MAKKKVFVSFDYDNDNVLKGSLISQARDPSSPFTLTDFSIQAALPAHEWISKAQSAIARCDVFIVLLGMHTHQAQGVLKEVNIAKGSRKYRFQLRTQGSNPKPVKGAGLVVHWTWPKLKAMLSK